MKACLRKLKRLCQTALSFVPTSLPQGMQEMEEWATSIIDMAEVPNNDSVRFALAASIMHLDSTSAYKPKRYFVLCMRKGAANEIASAKMRELKQRQIDAAAKAKELSEATDSQKVAPDVRPVQN